MNLSVTWSVSGRKGSGLGRNLVLEAVAKRYFVPPPALIAICRPYLEPARFARQYLSVKMPFNLAQI